jgi:hypothetical protein
MKSSRTKTTFVKNALIDDDATNLYEKLKNDISWENGITSKRNGNHPTRKGKMLSIEDPLFFDIMECVENTLLFFQEKYMVLGAYLNYYENGENYSPNHSHANTQQLIISLGATRTLIIGNKEYKMINGSAIIFGTATHGVPKEPEVKNGRISIATFMKKIE